MAIELRKKCIHCDAIKNLSDFKPDKKMKHGRSNMCNDCYRLKYRKPKAEQETIEDLPGEEWALVQELHNCYKISNYGRLLSLNYNREGRSKILSVPIQKGYYRVAMGFNDDGSINNISIHQLVGKYFVANPENKPHLNHIDGNKLNNFHLNIEWCTPSENRFHAFITGLQTNTGEKHSQAKITDQQAAEIKVLLKKGESKQNISKSMNISLGIVDHIAANRRWKHIKI